MKKQIAFVAGTALCVGAASAQMGSLGAAGSIVPNMRAAEAGGRSNVRAPVIASLTYDGSSNQGFAGQDFEVAFDDFDIYLLEPFSTFADANLAEFHSTGFTIDGNPFGMTDMIVEIHPASAMADLCDDDTVPAPLMRSTPGVGFWDGIDGITDFGGQCLPAGDYILRFAAEMEFGLHGQVFWFAQAGDHDNGGGTADDGQQNNPGEGFGFGVCFDILDGGVQSGINFILTGDEGDCGDVCPDPHSCGDWDGDGDSDGDDFFAYLDSFTSGDPCADITGNGSTDGDDFFAFLDAFVQDCP